MIIKQFKWVTRKSYPVLRWKLVKASFFSFTPILVYIPRAHASFKNSFFVLFHTRGVILDWSTIPFLERLWNISHNILLEKRAGFQKGRSCILNSSSVYWLQKSLDRVRRELLCVWYWRRDFSPQLINIFQSLINYTKIITDTGKGLSNEIYIILE